MAGQNIFGGFSKHGVVFYLKYLALVRKARKSEKNAAFEERICTIIRNKNGLVGTSHEDERARKKQSKRKIVADPAEFDEALLEDMFD